MRKSVLIAILVACFFRFCSIIRFFLSFGGGGAAAKEYPISPLPLIVQSVPLIGAGVTVWKFIDDKRSIIALKFNGLYTR
jgi:hypothetical protein